MTDQPVRWGILSTGAIAHSFVQDLLLMPDAEVLAVGSRAQVTADAFAQQYEIPRAYGDWDSLAADADLDVIYVATPHSAHHDAAKRCLRAGRAVLCEKPLTLDEPSSRDLVETAKAAGVFLMEAMWARCNPGIRRMQALIADGAIGEVSSVEANFGLAGPFSPQHRLRNPALGGGALLDLGIYPITLAHLVLGRPDSITAWASLTPEGVDQQTAMIFGYEAGGVALLGCGIVGATGATAVVTGQDGRIELPGPFFRPSRFTLQRNDAEPEAVVEPLAGHGYVPEAAEVHRCLREGLTESLLVPHATTLEVMSIMDEIRELVGVSYA
jgi:predicted dehydrogenase